jgi:hypothetical protein
MEVKQVQMTHRLQAVKLSGRLSSSFLLFHGWRITPFYSLYSSPQPKCTFANIHCQVKMTDSKLQCDLPLLRGSAFQLSIWDAKMNEDQASWIPTCNFTVQSSKQNSLEGREVWKKWGVTARRTQSLFVCHAQPCSGFIFVALVPHSLVQPDNLFFPGEHLSYLKAYVPWVW